MLWIGRNKWERPQAQSRGSSKDILLPLVVCVLSAIGSWAGVTLTAQYSTTAYQHQKAFEWEAKILDRRVETMERMARLIAKQPGIQDEWKRYLNFLKSMRPDEAPPRESSQKLEDYNAEYLNVLLLAQLYFGTDTNQAVSALTKVDSPWWMKPIDDETAVLAAMAKELRSTLPTFNSTLQVGEG